MELLTPGEMGRADALAIAGGVPGIELMRRAGLAVADACSRMAGHSGQVLVLAGPGNNGGDGFVAAKVLRQRGYRVELLLLGDPERLSGDAALAFSEMQAAGLTVGILSQDTLDRVPGQASVVIDALFGAGLSRPIEGVAGAAIDRVNGSGVPVLAVDLPSGVNGASGGAMGPAIRASRTVTFFRLKPGHLLLPGRLLAGRVELADIGIPASVLDEVHGSEQGKTWRNDPELWGMGLRPPRLDGHKYARGHAVVVSGPALSTGAARLAAGAALRAGAGLVTVATPPSAALVNASHLTAVMVRSFRGSGGLAEMLADRRLNAIALGPGAGVGEETRALALTCLSGERAVLLDADAITSFTGEVEALAGALSRRTGARAADVVLTPHDGEFARLFGERAGGPSRLARARAGARASGAVVVLKGADTVVADPDGRAAINDSAPAWLATAGSGDVLSGIVTGLLAQGLGGFEAACAGVWLHGRAGALAGPALTAEDLEPALRLALAEFFSRAG
ncbi:NAD(P)H-hydrate dehydratase [Stappia sp. 28M-7]|uniref:NAD(P)H-hydrate dehydratase n=1 Tax=Stappia sp. 28M-7 TaxID=2762596 RepID=UPI00163CDCDA|nr:NAD(P)H-hydrate dehydratase [Stappia sp. 28M-7]